MKIVITAILLIILSTSMSFAETSVMAQYLKAAADASAISPTHKITVGVGVDVITEPWNVTKSEHQSISLKLNIGTAVKMSWYIEALGFDANGVEHWQRCSDNVDYSADTDTLEALSLPVNSVFRVHFIGDTVGSYEVEILTINRK